MKASQNDRVEAWLWAHERTTIADWDRQPACDGGDRITRLARCIGDLRKRGVPIPPSTLVKIGNAWVAEYRLDGTQGQRGERPEQGDSSARRTTLAASSSQSCPERVLSSLEQAPVLAHSPLGLGQAQSFAPRCAILDLDDFEDAA